MVYGPCRVALHAQEAEDERMTVPDSMQSAMAKRALEQLTFVQRVKAAGAHEQAS